MDGCCSFGGQTEEVLRVFPEIRYVTVCAASAVTLCRPEEMTSPALTDAHTYTVLTRTSVGVSFGFPQTPSDVM